MSHALPGQSPCAFGNDQRQAFHHVPLVLRQAARFQPKNSGGQRAVDGRLRFLIVHSHQSQGALPLSHPATQVGWTKRMFEIHAGGEPDDGPSGKVSFERAPQARLVSSPRRSARRGRTLVAIAAEVETCRSILAHALHLQAERRRLDFRIQHAAHEIPFARPQVQQALVVFAGDRILRVRQVERNRTIFHHDRGARAVEEISKHLAEGFWGHIRDLLLSHFTIEIVHESEVAVCDRCTAKLFGLLAPGQAHFGNRFPETAPPRSWDNADSVRRRSESFSESATSK